MSRHPLDYLPPELWEVVSTYLKPEDLYHLSEACRFWNDLLLDRKLLPITWFPRSNGDISNFALVGAVSSSKNVYIARAFHEGENMYWTDPPIVTIGVIPGRLHEGDHFAYVSYGGQEFAKTDYEVLVVPPGPETLTWIQTEGGNIPEHAFVAGNDPNGDPYYISRITHEGTLTVGKVHQRYGLGYIAYDGKEHEYPKYEILVLTELGRALK